MSAFLFAGLIGCLIGCPLIAELIARREEISWRRAATEPGDVDSPFQSKPSSSGVTAGGVISGAAVSGAAVSGEETLGDGASGQSSDVPSDSNPLAWKGWRTMTVVGVHDESPDCRSFVLRSLDHTPLPGFLGGQYLPIRVQDPATGARTTRCYSLSSGPSEPNYRITVKRVPGGLVSNRLHDRIRVGDTIDVQTPAGQFHIDLNRQTRPLVLIAAGIGITPMLSMLMHSLELSPTRQIHLFYQLRHRDNAPFLSLLRRLNESLAETRSNLGGPLLQLHVWFSQAEPEPGSDHFGRIDAAELLHQIGTHDGDFRICGPNAFMSSLASGLVEHGVASERVAYESFGGKAKGVGAIAVDSANTDADSSDPALARTIHFESSGQVHRWNPSDGSLLDVAERDHIEIESSCRSGICGMCVRSLLAGQVRYPEEPTCDVQDGEVVMCVAQPESDLRIDA